MSAMLPRTAPFLPVLIAASAFLGGVAPAAGQEASVDREASPLSRAASTAQADLDRSLKALTDLRAAIESEKLPLTRELGRLEGRLVDLRRRQEEGARAQDLRTLEINNSGAALKLRQDEISYVSNLLDEYARGFESVLHVSELQRYGGVVEKAKLARENRDLTLTEKLRRQVDVLETSRVRVDELVGGVRYEGEAVDPQGVVAAGRFALVGPVVLFAAAGGGATGLALPQTGSTRAVIRPLEEALNRGVAGLAGTGEGLLPLDPTRGGALKELLHRGSLVHYFKRGGPIMWPLLFVSLLATTVILERLLFLAREQRRRDQEVVDAIMSFVSRGDVSAAIAAGENSRDFVARALTYALKHREKSLSNALVRAAGQELVRFNRGIPILDTCVTMAPLLGLLGTVTGMMGSFGMLGGADLSAPAQITGGIAEALIATAFGLGIAISALIPMNYLHSKSDAARHEMEDASTHLELLMKPVLEAEAAARERRIHSLVQTAPAAGAHATAAL
jgi:biopolymer transport protein ExbB